MGYCADEGSLWKRLKSDSVGPQTKTISSQTRGIKAVVLFFFYPFQKTIWTLSNPRLQFVSNGVNRPHAHFGGVNELSIGPFVFPRCVTWVKQLPRHGELLVISLNLSLNESFVPLLWGSSLTPHPPFSDKCQTRWRSGMILPSVMKNAACRFAYCTGI